MKKLFRGTGSVLICLAVIAAASCGSNTDVEDSLREELNQTQAQIEDLQETIETLQSDNQEQVEQQIDEESQVEEEIVLNEENQEDTDSVEEVPQILTNSFVWYENSESVESLQEALGVNADGWYGSITREAHLEALLSYGLPTDGVPDEGLIPCPAQEEMPDSEAIPMSTIHLDMNGDGVLDFGQTYYDSDTELFYAQVSGSDFGPYWVELDDIGPGPANQWKASHGTDINNDNKSEFWIRQIPFGASSVGYRVVIFEDCELQIAYIPDSNELFIDGGTVGTSWRIACENEDGSPVIVQYQITAGPTEAEQSNTGMVFELNSTGFTFVKIRNLETFEDPGGPYGTPCESWIHDDPPWLS